MGARQGLWQLGATGSRREAGRLAGRAGVILACILAVVAVVLGPAPTGVGAQETGAPAEATMPQSLGPTLEVVGALGDPGTPEGPENAVAIWEFESHRLTVMAVDAERRRLYAHHPIGSFTDVFVEYDLTTDVPTPVRARVVDVPGAILDDSDGVAFDPGVPGDPDQPPRLFALHADLPNANQDGAAPGRSLTVIDLGSLEIDSTVDLNTVIAPGYVVYGTTYAPEDDRLYLLGEMGVNFSVGGRARTLGLQVASPVPMVAAMDETGSTALWRRPVPQCQNLLITRGALIARSAFRPSLYFFCHPASGPGPQPITYPGQAGLYRLNITADATQDDALAFSRDYFPISGAYFKLNSTGAAAFDRRSDRVYVTSLSDVTPGAFVFDGRLEAWAGHVAAEDNCAPHVGVHEGLGRFYVGGSGGTGCDTDRYPIGYLISSDGAATPPSQGAVVDVALGSSIVDDPESRRFFARARLAQGEPQALYVFRDLARPSPQPPETDWDARTDGVPEGPDTTVFASGNGSGFGSILRVVGGWEAPATAIASIITPSELNQARLGLGHRGATSADVPSVSMTTFSVTADGQVATPDGATFGDLDRFQQELFDPPDSDPEPVGCEDDVVDQPPEDPSDPDSDPDGERTPSCVLDWPFPRVECSDGRSDPVQQSRESPGNASSVEVSCNFEDQLARSTVASGSLSAGDLPPGVSVGANRSDVTARRVDGETVVTSVASVEGFTLSTPAGSLSLGRVSATARTVAGGQSGTSAARWTRLIDGIAVHGSDGEQLYPDPESGGPTSCVTVVDAADGGEQELDSCDRVFAALTDLLELRVKFSLRRPGVMATPGGAFAAISEPDAPFYEGQATLGDSRRDTPAFEMVVFNDTTEKSRLLVQLAGVRADSIYTISELPTHDFPDGGADTGSSIPNDDPSSGSGDPTPLPQDLGNDVSAADLSSGVGDSGQSTGGPVQAVPPVTQAPVTVETPQRDASESAATPAVAPEPTQVARGPLALLTLPGLHAARLFGVWALLVAAFVVAGRRGLLLQTTTGGKA